MKTIAVDLGINSYNITIDSGICNRLHKYIDDICEKKTVGIITDSNVSELYAESVKGEVEQCAGKVHLIVVPAGEQSKSPEQAIAIMSSLLNLGFTRDSVLIALGGGVIGDLTGFIASVFLRGIPYIAIPTTLLAQVDSSVGGKTAVNLPEGKNLMGTFYQPKRVIIDPAYIDTLDKREFSCGMAEVIKYGVIRDRKLFEKLETYQDFSLIADDVIAACCRIKADIVERDEKDTGERMLLNFGHTVGHAIEKNAGYGQLSHGAAVAIGMCVMAKYGEAIGKTESRTAGRIIALCRKFGLPTEYPKCDALFTAISYDKKNFGDYLEVVMAERIGVATVDRVCRADFVAQLKRIW